MTKEIIIGNTAIKLKATGGMFIRYKEAFGTEYYDDMLKIKSLEKNIEATTKEKLELSAETAYKLIWAMAKTADDNISEPEQWIDEFEVFPAADILKQANELLNKSICTCKRPHSDNGDTKQLTAENLVACSVMCGLSMQDIDNRSIGFLMGCIAEYADIKSGGRSDTVRNATQADFNNF